MSAIGVKADMTIALKMSAFDPRRGLDHFEHICSTIALISCIFCSHIFSVHFGLVGVKPVFEISVAIAAGASGALAPPCIRRQLRLCRVREQSTLGLGEFFVRVFVRRKQAVPSRCSLLLLAVLVRRDLH